MSELLRLHHPITHKISSVRVDHQSFVYGATEEVQKILGSLLYKTKERPLQLVVKDVSLMEGGGSTR